MSVVLLPGAVVFGLVATAVYFVRKRRRRDGTGEAMVQEGGTHVPKAAAVDGGAHLLAQDKKRTFPIHVMRMKDFLALKELRPHNELVKQGLVVPLHSGTLKLPAFKRMAEELGYTGDAEAAFAKFDADHSGDISLSELSSVLKSMGIDTDGGRAQAIMQRFDRAGGEYINFVSHQWLGWAKADPDNAHLSTMQAVFRAANGADPKAVFRDEDQFYAYTRGLSKENMKNVAASKMSDNAEMSAVDERGRSDI